MKTIGVLGGMGPAATNDFCAWITKLTPAQRDQDHVPVLCYNNSAVPDRTSAILLGGPSPVPELVRMSKVLTQAGADFLAIPCNTAHYFLAEIQQQVEIPMLDMIAETVQATLALAPNMRCVGLLATTGTIHTGIYRKAFAAEGVEVISPVPELQDQVYDTISAIKAGELDGPAQVLTHLARHLIERGAEVVVAGCTELPLVLVQSMVAVPLLNPNEILARAALALALA